MFNKLKLRPHSMALDLLVKPNFEQEHIPAFDIELQGLLFKDIDDR